MDTAGTVLAVADGCRAVEAARDASAASGPCRVRHGCAWTPGSADGSHRVLRRYGLVAQTVCCRDRPARLRGLGTRGRRGWPPAALSQDRCVALARSGSRAVAPWWLPSVGTSPWPMGNRVRASRRCARRRVAPVRALRGCRRAGGRRRPRYASCHRHLPRLHAPEPRTGAPVLASVRRFSGETRTVRSNVAAPVEAGR